MHVATPTGNVSLPREIVIGVATEDGGGDKVGCNPFVILVHTLVKDQDTLLTSVTL